LPFKFAATATFLLLVFDAFFEVFGSDPCDLIKLYTEYVRIILLRQHSF